MYVYANECVNVNDARARAECVFAASVVGPRPDAAGAPSCFACSPERGRRTGRWTEREDVRPESGEKGVEGATATRITTTISTTISTTMDSMMMTLTGTATTPGRRDSISTRDKRLKTSVSPRGRAKSTDDARSPRNREW